MRQPIKFYVDEHVATAVVKGLRQRGADVLTVLEAGGGWRLEGTSWRLEAEGKKGRG